MTYRLTRNIYKEGTLGHSDFTARQGYYIEADSEEEAIKKMKERFPGETFAIG